MNTNRLGTMALDLMGYREVPIFEGIASDRVTLGHITPIYTLINHLDPKTTWDISLCIECEGGGLREIDCEENYLGFGFLDLCYEQPETSISPFRFNPLDGPSKLNFFGTFNGYISIPPNKNSLAHIRGDKVADHIANTMLFSFPRLINYLLQPKLFGRNRQYCSAAEIARKDVLVGVENPPPNLVKRLEELAHLGRLEDGVEKQLDYVTKIVF